MKKIKKFLIEYKSLMIVIILIGVAVWFFNFRDTNKNYRTAIPNPSFNNFSETLGLNVINCQFKVFSDFSFKDDGGKDKLIKYGTDNQSKPMEIVFSGLNTLNPVMKGNNGEDPLLIMGNDENEISLASSNGMGDLFFYKIYKKQKVATWYKSYNMLGNPYALLSMGYCY